MSVPPMSPPLGPPRRRRPPPIALPSWNILIRAPLFAAVGAYVGTVLTARAWVDCPAGNDAGGNFALNGLMVEMFFLMTACLLLAQVSWWALTLPVPVLHCLQWLVPLVAAVALTVLYRIGMQSPVIHPDGSCWQGYPPFPFQPKPGPH